MTIGKQIFNELDSIEILTDLIITETLEKYLNNLANIRQEDEYTVILFYKDNSFIQVRFKDETFETAHGIYEFKLDGDDTITEVHLH